jgi:REP element-mobilizing transposase RayT
MTFYRRNLPHWIPDGRSIFITWRLYGSLPKGVLGKKAESSPSDSEQEFLAFDRHLDSAAFGPLWLKDPEIADYAEEPILHGAELGRYALHAYVIMPNHVHVLLEPQIPLAKITNVMKGVAARYANASLGRVGKPFWQDESFDHWIRTPPEHERIRQYIEWNPVSAGLAVKPEDWRWSSALRRNRKPG